MWGIFNLVKTKDVEATKKLANELAEPIRFFTQHSKLSERVKANPKSFFEGEKLTYVDFAIIPHVKFLDLLFNLVLKTSFFDAIENQDDYV